MKIFLVLVQVLGFLVLSYGETDVCQTPKGEKGICKSISECPYLHSIIKRRPLKPEDADYLRKSRCGPRTTLPNACCPLPTTPTIVQPVSSDLLPSTKICGSGSVDRVYGGTEANLNEFPWMALIEYKISETKRRFICGGVLINKKYILTAAHCMKGRLLNISKVVSVRLGEHNTESNIDCVNNYGIKSCNPTPVDIEIEERIVHEGYDPYNLNWHHDIGLLRLKEEVTFSDFIKPICLPTTSFIQKKDMTGENFIVAGWGETEKTSQSSIKLKVEVPFKSLADCAAKYTKKIWDGQICAGGVKGKDSCTGDSGGPLMQLIGNEAGEYNWYSVGVVSFGPERCGIDKWPGVYTKVDSYLPWIISKLRP